MSPLSFDNGWKDRCVNTVDEKVSKAKSLVNFGPVTPKSEFFLDVQLQLLRSCDSFACVVTTGRLIYDCAG